MSTDKPTKTEDEYFAREDAEKVKRLKEKLRQEFLEEQRQNIKSVCYMKCPKCGGDLSEVVFRGIKIDRCTSCRGVWLDDGELEKLAGPEEKSIVREIIELFRPR
ncbi:MAG TPA: zf-TFIIB domain-containing protein [Thermodesulfobacteriota bacterium]|nr:zf-TFIIB domain-containing protein [Thermodesulfobacteriota bacterium]